MRKLLSILLTLFLIISLAACNDNEDPQSSAAPESSESSEPVSSEPENSEPESSDPESSDSESSQPETSKTDNSQPESSDSESSQPETSKTETSKTDNPVASTTTAKTTTRITTTRRTVTSNNSVNNTTVTGTTTTTKPSYILPTSGDWEKPVTINTAVLYNEKHSSYDSKAESMRQNVLNAKDTLKAASGRNTYYISYRGNDKNDGLSAQTPWLTADNLSNAPLKSGDVVLFERGGVYRGMAITMIYGVSYGAYGDSTKPKPQLYGGDKDYADEGLWKETSTANVWRVKVPDGTPDIGNIVFDYGKVCASDGKVYSTKGIKRDYDFYHDAENNYVYLYLSKGNPGKLHKSIEIVPGLIALSGYLVKNVTVENLCIRYYYFGVSTNAATNITVRGCEIGYIGGSAMSPGTRAGNGIELYGKTNGALVENCWIYQCYDAGYTNQGPGSPKGIVVRKNLIEYCLYNIEVWVSNRDVDKIIDSSYESNILRFAGYGFGSNNRGGSSTMAAGNITTCVGLKLLSENFVIKNNVFDCSYRYIVRLAYPNDSQGRGPTITNNTWIQQAFDPADNNSSILATNAKDPAAPSVGVTAFTGNEIIRRCNTLSEMKESVKLFDKNPTAIILEK